MAIAKVEPSKGFLGSKAFELGAGFMTGGPAGAAMASMGESPMKRAYSLYQLGGQGASSSGRPASTDMGALDAKAGAGVPGQLGPAGPSLGVNTDLGYGPTAMKRKFGSYLK